MKYDACVDCGIEKTGLQRKCLRCRSCGAKGNSGAVGNKSKAGQTFSPETREKMRLAKLGKTNSLQHRRNISLAKGCDGDLENRRYPGLAQWTARNKAKTPFCEWCFSEEGLEAHHVIPKAKMPQYAAEDWNCRILCKPCHATCHKQGGY